MTHQKIYFRVVTHFIYQYHSGRLWAFVVALRSRLSKFENKNKKCKFILICIKCPVMRLLLYNYTMLKQWEWSFWTDDQHVVDQSNEKSEEKSSTDVNWTKEWASELYTRIRMCMWLFVICYETSLQINSHIYGSFDQDLKIYEYSNIILNINSYITSRMGVCDFLCDYV